MLHVATAPYNAMWAPGPVGNVRRHVLVHLYPRRYVDSPSCEASCLPTLRRKCSLHLGPHPLQSSLSLSLSLSPSTGASQSSLPSPFLGLM
eukprot:2239619-Heterocapsa_arctica.AAC.1